MDGGGFGEMISNRREARKEKDEEFMEEDVWGVVNFKKDYSSASSLPACRIPAAPRMIPRINIGTQHQQSSAPVNIPDWSKIHSKKPNWGGLESDAWGAGDGGNGGNKLYFDGAAVEDGDDDDSDEMVPPHEIIARRLARSPVISCSMCEGVGRTLKGRDLSKLRNAILTKTGFLE